MYNQNEIKILTHTCSIGNHPVSKLPLEIRERYLQGLHAVLPVNNPIMRVLYKAWEKSILGQGQRISYASGDTKNKVRAAIKLNRINGRWVRLSYPFFFDCFYLTSLCKSGMFHKLLEQYSEYCNVVTKKHLRDVYGYFLNDQTCNKIPAELIHHKETNEQFANAPLKRILVVANVSAGKSTLINALVGRELNKTATNTCTKDLCYVFGKPLPDGVTVKTRNESKYKYVDSFDQCLSDNGEQIGMFFPSGLLQEKKICFIDTPGFNNARNPEHGEITEKAIKGNDYDAIVYVANATNMGVDDEHRLMEIIVHNTQKPIVFVMNQLDKLRPDNDSIEDSILNYRQDIMRMGVQCPTIALISARVALLDRLDSQGLLDDEERFEFEQFKRRFTIEYYDLPLYVLGSKGTPSNRLVDKTGVTLLESIINSIIIQKKYQNEKS